MSLRVASSMHAAPGPRAIHGPSVEDADGGGAHEYDDDEERIILLDLLPHCTDRGQCNTTSSACAPYACAYASGIARKMQCLECMTMHASQSSPVHAQPHVERVRPQSPGTTILWP